MTIEKPKDKKQSAKELETHHFYEGIPEVFGGEFLKDHASRYNFVKELLRLDRKSELIINGDSQDSIRALVQNNKGEIIFSTDLPSEISELAEIVGSR